MVASVALLASPAQSAYAFSAWEHGGIPETSCGFCHQATGGVTDAACTLCHTTFRSMSGQSCWSCHEPGADTSGLSSPSSACAQGCHLYSQVAKDYVAPYAHGTSPHLGASGYGKSCLDCHEASGGVLIAGKSPHHDGVPQAPPSCTDCHNGVLATKQVSHDGATCERCHDGMNIPPRPASCTTCHSAAVFGGADCLGCHAKQVHTASPAVAACVGCHSGYRKHAGEVACTKCHTNARYFHHGTQRPKAKTCRSCHAKRHAGRSVPGSKCAGCHKGNAPTSKPRAQHSSRITKKYVCSLCHSKPLHARSYGAKLTCRTCHRSRFHSAQATPGNSVCTRCHGSAWRHADGYRCTTCHRKAVHDATPRG